MQVIHASRQTEQQGSRKSTSCCLCSPLLGKVLGGKHFVRLYTYKHTSIYTYLNTHTKLHNIMYVCSFGAEMKTW